MSKTIYKATFKMESEEDLDNPNWVEDTSVPRQAVELKEPITDSMMTILKEVAETNKRWEKLKIRKKVIVVE